MTRQRQPLTRRQRELFDYLQSRMEAGQDAPSLRTAAEELGVSHTAVAGLLQTLQDKGWLRAVRQRRVPRRGDNGQGKMLISTASKLHEPSFQ